MHLSPHSLRQIDDAYLRSLDPEALRGLSVRLLADLKEAWDRLNQGPENSSRPPSSRAPWERKGGAREADADAGADAADGECEPEPAAAKPAAAKPAEAKPTKATGPPTGPATGGVGDRPDASVPGARGTPALPGGLRRLWPAAGAGGGGSLHRVSSGRFALGRSGATGADLVGGGSSLL